MRHSPIIVSAFVFYAIGVGMAGAVYAQAPEPLPAPVPAPVVVPVAAPAAPPAAPVVVRPVEQFAIVKSIMFSTEQVGSIRKALQVFKDKDKPEASSANEDYLSQITGGVSNVVNKRDLPPFIYPQFYLESFIYHSSTNWTVSVNGQRFNASDPKMNEGDLRIVKIGDEQVMFDWTPENMERVKASWNVNKNQRVAVDMDRRSVIFALRLNQTFSSYLMDVVEGKVMPVQAANDLGVVEDKSAVPMTPAGKAPAAPAAVVPAAPAPQAPKPIGKMEKTGLKGLINSYEKLQGTP